MASPSGCASMLTVARRTLTLLLALVLASSCGSPVPSGPLLLEQVTWRLRARVTYRNTAPQAATVKVEMPLPQSREPWQEVELLSTAPAGAEPATDEAGNRLSVFTLRDVPPGGTATCEVVTRVRRTGVAFDADARRAAPPGPALARFLKAEERILADDPLLRQTAGALVEGEPNPYYRLLTLYDFVRTLEFQLTRRAQDDRESLQRRVVQCADAAGLLVSLCRSVGIPARYVAGVYLRPEEPATTTTHAWTEAWVEPFGWLPLDPTMGRFADTRTSRFAQLEPAYVLLWEGRASEGFSASGPGAGGEFRLSFHHEEESRRARPNPALPVPPLSGTADLQSVLPPGRAGALLQQALATPARDRKVQLLREALAQEPGSLAVYKVLVESSPPEELRTWLEAAPDGPAVRYARGLLALEEGGWSEAEASLAAAGDGFAVQHARAELFLRSHQPGRAAGALARALGQVVTPRLVENALGLFSGLGDPAGLREVAGAASRRFPEVREYRIAEAQALFQLGRRGEALRQLEALREQDPQDGVVPGLMGMLALQAGERDRARELIRQSLDRRLPDREREFLQGVLEQL